MLKYITDKIEAARQAEISKAKCRILKNNHKTLDYEKLSPDLKKINLDVFDGNDVDIKKVLYDRKDITNYKVRENLKDHIRFYEEGIPRYKIKIKFYKEEVNYKFSVFPVKTSVEIIEKEIKVSKRDYKKERDFSYYYDNPDIDMIKQLYTNYTNSDDNLFYKNYKIKSFEKELIYEKDTGIPKPQVDIIYCTELDKRKFIEEVEDINAKYVAVKNKVQRNLLGDYSYDLLVDFDVL